MISKRAKQTKFTRQSKQPNLQIDPKSLKAKKDAKASDGPCDLGPKQDKRVLNEGMDNHPKNATKQSKTVKRAWRINQQVDRTIKTPKLPRRARYTKPLDALGLKT